MPASGSIGYSEVESKRFGLRIYRGTADAIEPKRLTTMLLADDVDIAILRLPSAYQPKLSILETTGFPYIVADTLVYYELNMEQHAASSLQNGDLEFVRCGPEHATDLRLLVGRVFAGYMNHYHSNPILKRKDIQEAYVDWALRYSTSDNPARSGWLVKRDGANVAFMTGLRDGERCEVVLGGVDPSTRGSGVYSDFIRFAIKHYKDSGCRLMTVSTQTQNLAVQRVWGRMGFEMARSAVTVHVNSLLGHSAVDASVYELAVSDEGELRCVAGGGLAGSVWPNADGAGGGHRVPLLALGAMLRDCCETTFPGPGAVLRRGSFAVYDHMRRGQSYRLRVSFPVVGSGESCALALARVTDTQKRTCLLCYAELHGVRS
jgi:GNAT superfamily N-acetyltransferase